MFEGFRANRQFGSLDGIRAISILMVIWHHSGGSVLSGPLGKMFLGVDLFFVVSGFLIVTLLLRERAKNGSISFRNFYIRRVLRIFPLYYAVLAAALVVALISHGQNAIAMRGDLPFAALYISNWVDMHSILSITWSLSAEEQFYLVWPCLMLVFGARSVYALVALMVTSIGLELAHVYAGLALPAMLYLHTFLPILLGVALAYLLHHRSTFEPVARILGHRYSSAVALVVVVALLCWPVQDITGFPQIFMQTGLAVFLATCVIREDHVLAPLLKSRPMARIGVLSYAMYLFHMWVWTFVAKVVPSSESLGWFAHDAAIWVLTTLLTAGCAALSYRYFEGRFLSMKDRFVPAR